MQTDTLLSVLAAFGIYSTALFLSAEAVLRPAGIRYSLRPDPVVEKSHAGRTCVPEEFEG